MKCLKKIARILMFIHLILFKNVLVTLNNCFCKINSKGQFNIDKEYSFENAKDNKMNKFSKHELAL